MKATKAHLLLTSVMMILSTTAEAQLFENLFRRRQAEPRGDWVLEGTVEDVRRRETQQQPRRQQNNQQVKRPRADVGQTRQYRQDEFPPAPVQNPQQNQWTEQTSAKSGTMAQLGQWVLKKTSWDEFDEMQYSEFVRAIGKSGCKTVDSCIRHASNPYRESDPPKELYKFWSDCADWPYFLRSYFAWKNGLPMVFATGMSPLELNEQQKADVSSGAKKEQADVRYSWNGNKPGRRIVVPNQQSGLTDFFDNHTRMQNSVHTATFRVDPRTNLGDLYTPMVTPGSIRPGTAVYDPNGHVGVVYDVTEDGQVMVFDALVDTQSISPRRPYSSDFYKRSNIRHGGWFQNFRPVTVVGATYHPELGGYFGGRAVLATNEQIPDFSTEMFGNTQTAEGKSAYNIEGKTTTSFQEFLRRRMFIGRYKLDAVAEFKVRLNAICDDFGSRVGLVQNATQDGIASMPHAAKLPDTIYGGEAEWDVYSTPGGDVRRRNSITLALDNAREIKTQIDQRNPDYIYRGQNLKLDLIQAASQVLKSCQVSYNNSNGQKVTMNLAQMLERVPRMSFSPYHCIELRWGANSPEELESCQDVSDLEKMRWYRAQQSLRNLMVRDTNIFTGYSLQELEQKASSIGPVKSQNFDMIQALQTEL